MALIKTPEEIEKLRAGGKILAGILESLAKEIRPGITTWSLEEAARREIERASATPAFLGYRPDESLPAYPTALCTSVNDEVVHCVPDKKRILSDGDLISLDLGIKFDGLFTDAAITVPVGKASRDVLRLAAATREALAAGIRQARPDNTIGDVAAAIEAVARREKLGVIRDLVGHGVGHAIHEPPNIPNYGRAGTLEKLRPGMILAIEPMFTLGDWRIQFFPKSWRVTTADGSLAAHFEHTVAVTADGPAVLTEV